MSDGSRYNSQPNKESATKNPSRFEADNVDVAAAATNKDFVGWGVAEAAVSDKNNDDITTSRVCASNDWPHESIKWSKIYGRILSDGRREILGYKPIDYVTDTLHQHKKKIKQQQPEGHYYMGFDLK